MSKKMMILFLVLSLSFCSIALAQEATLNSFADNVMGKLKNADFDSLFNDFYIPKENSARDTQNDKEAIISMFKELQNKVGVLDNFSNVNLVAEKLITMDIITGTPQTTGIIPATDLFYKVMFNQFKEGYVKVGVHKEREKLFIKDITIGFPVSNQKSSEIVKEIGMFMQNIAAEQQKSNAVPVSE